MQTVYEENATIAKSGGSLYVLLPPTYYKYLDIENEENVNHDIKVSMALSKYGKFLYLHSPKQQKKWQKEQEKKEEE